MPAPTQLLYSISQARVNIWIDYFGELLNQVVIVNPPRLLNALLKVILSLQLRVRNAYNKQQNAFLDNVFNVRTASTYLFVILIHSW